MNYCDIFKNIFFCHLTFKNRFSAIKQIKTVTNIKISKNQIVPNINALN